MQYSYEEYMTTSEFLTAQVKVLAEALEESMIQAEDYEKMYDQAMDELIKTADKHEYIREHYLSTLEFIIKQDDEPFEDFLKIRNIRTRSENILKNGI